MRQKFPKPLVHLIYELVNPEQFCFEKTISKKEAVEWFKKVSFIWRNIFPNKRTSGIRLANGRQRWYGKGNN